MSAINFDIWSNDVLFLRMIGVRFFGEIDYYCIRVRTGIINNGSEGFNYY